MRGFWRALAIFLFGGFMGAMDVAMNANAVAVEQSMRRAIMSSCHAFWSLGGLIGGLLGGGQSGNSMGDIASSVLDRNHDGSSLDDIASMAFNYVTGK